MAKQENDSKAQIWWRSLSMNEQDAFVKKHFPVWSTLDVMVRPHWITEMWEKEVK